MTTPSTKRGAALASVGSGLLLTLLKLTVGVATGSLAILAEAAHSALDLLAAGITLLVVQIADLPPDDNHPYGHARAEHLGALAEAVLLVATAALVLREAFLRVFVRAEMPETSVWAFVVIITSLLIDWRRSRALKRAAEEFKSQALAADAAHFTNDMLSTAVVLVALTLIAVTEPLGLLPEWLLARVDAIAAAVVALIALWVSWGMSVHAVRALMDDVPADLSRRLARQVAALPDVIPESVQMRTRFVGQQPYVEVSLGTPRGGSLEQAHQLTEAVEAVVREELAGANVLVHVVPARTAAEPYATAVYASANRLGLHVHNLDLYQLADAIRVDMDLELPTDLTLGEAHTSSERLERAICDELGGSTVVAVHLEPRRDRVQPAVRYAPLNDSIREVVRQLPGAASVAQVETLLTDAGAIVTLRCAFPPETPLSEVHTAMARMERDLRRAVPDVVRVQIDPEPAQHA
ncbi:MAG TPA: cation diffusion facilitator family transporter [Kouleothrix sp.]|uniref:cation diffusion facilitator family transporter n=1 Tax=Kouleothrix sp. TaxID=2779161 RepID=UPI002BBBBC9C|nr:cation diffusion facilitator family transporter [Kouleothrix sp.]HRC76315.1 cation diffusion facilitator family transporter [Kouleothrix sp.]